MSKHTKDNYTWIFFFEETPKIIEFEIEAPDSVKAFQKAHDEHGDQVDDMGYKIKKSTK